MAQLRKVPNEVLEPLPAGLWKPILWMHCEGQPILVALLVAVIGVVIIKTAASITVGLLVLAGAWFALRALGERDPRAFRVFRRARRYRNPQSGTIAARPTWGSTAPRMPVRRH